MATTPVRTSLKWDVLVTKRQGLNRDLIHATEFFTSSSPASNFAVMFS
jgi:hypothetical protein